MLPTSIESDMSTTMLKNAAKHVSKACLECRSRHLKCSGSQPCSRCDRLSKDCTYVKSHRGGSRKKGVSKFNKRKTMIVTNPDTTIITPISMSTDTDESRSAIKRALASVANIPKDSSGSGKIPSHNLGYQIPPVEDLIKLPCINHKESTDKKKKNYSELLKMPCAFTCLEPQYRGKTPPCMGGEVRISNTELDLTKVPFKETSSFYEKVNSNDYIKKMMDAIDIDEVIELYYSGFHSIHPLLPERTEFKEYINAVPHAYELILAMKIMGEAQSSSLYASDAETVNFKLNQIFDYINTIVGIDIISLQAMALVSLIAHFSSLHDLSARIRIEAVKALLSLGYNMIDFEEGGVSEQRRKDDMAPDSPQSETDCEVKSQRKFLSSERLSKLSEKTIFECARKLFWELHFIDVVIGTADGRTISKLATAEISVDFPHSVLPTQFDYKSRAEGCQLVTEAIRLNVSVIDQQSSTSLINVINTTLGNWEMRFSHPELLDVPFMVDTNGNINEGVFQAMLLYNYARIFAHRPFSYLWKDITSDNEEKLGSNRSTVNSRKVIETRKTIDGANLIATCLLDTSPKSIHKRTPLYGCSVAFACLVHLSSYIWAKSVMSNLDRDDVVYKRDLENELKEYLQFIQFEINTLSVISKHWMLANKLSTYLKDTLVKVTPELYESIKHAIPRLNMRLVPDITVELEVQRRPSNSSDVTMLTDMTGGKILSFNSDQSSVTCEDSLQVINSSNFDSRDNSNSDINHDKNNDNIDNNNNNSNDNNDDSSISRNDNSNGLNNNYVHGALNEIDFNSYDFGSSSFYHTKANDIPDSPMSETGCDWIDKNLFEFDGEDITDILGGYGPE